MIVLGFDTSTPATAVSLRLADATMLQARDDPEGTRRPGHATRLLPLASGLLVEADIGWGEIERIAVGVGPGTFTGLRIGVATARGLAQSLAVELVGVSSLRALARAALTGTVDEATGVLAVIDARRGEVFAAVYEGDMELIAPRALAPAGLALLLKAAEDQANPGRWIAVGDGATRYRDALRLPGVLVPDDGSPAHRIDARAICALGSGSSPAGSTGESAGSTGESAGSTGEFAGSTGESAGSTGEITVEPDYRRRPDAEIALEGTVSG